MKKKHYQIDNLLSRNAVYSMAIGRRSNGKTFAVKYIALFGYHKKGIDINGYLDDGTQMAYIRRWDQDFIGKASKFYDDFLFNPELGNIIESKTKGKWNSVIYDAGHWYLRHIDADGKQDARDTSFFAVKFALTGEEHYKSNPFPMVRIAFFDEFITRGYYLPDEFVKLENLISTIVRERQDLRIFMMANTVNKYCPYFNEMGLTNVKFQKQGTIDFYTYGKSDTTVAVEYCLDNSDANSKTASKYFAFDNPKLKMITTGEWEIDLYPHLPMKYAQSDIQYMYFIVFDKEILQCEIVKPKESRTPFTYIHRKTSPIKDENKALIYQQGYDPRMNYRRYLTRPILNIEKKIAWFYTNDKVFYQDNTVGETVRNYLAWCKTSQ